MATTALRIHHKNVQHKTYHTQAIRVNWKFIYFFIAALTLVLLFFYIFEVNQLTRGAYQIKSYDGQISVLSNQNMDLEASFAQSDFLAGVLQKAEALNFEKTTAITYLPMLQSTLAER